MKKNTFKTFEYYNRYKTFNSAFRYINANVLDATNDVSPDEKAITDSRLKYEELKRQANTTPEPKRNLFGKVIDLFKTYKSVFLSFMIFFGFTLSVIGFFMLLTIIF